MAHVDQLVRRLVRLLPWLRRHQADSEIQRELDLHLALETQEHTEAGMSPDEARRVARLRLGNAPLIREDARAVWGWRWADAAAQDVRYAWRSLRRTPGFSAVVILTMGLGVGAVTAFYSVVDPLLLRPLPFREPTSLYKVLTVGSDGGYGATVAREQVRGFCCNVWDHARESVGWTSLHGQSEHLVDQPRLTDHVALRHPPRLSLAERMHHLDTADGPPRRGELLEPQHRPGAAFDGEFRRSMHHEPREASWCNDVVRV